MRPTEHPGYNATASALCARMCEFLRKHPAAMAADDPWHLFDYGFTLGDLDPSYAQAAYAFSAAKQAVRDEARP